MDQERFNNLLCMSIEHDTCINIDYGEIIENFRLLVLKNRLFDLIAMCFCITDIFICLSSVYY